MPGGGFKKQALEVRHMVQRMMNDPFIRVKEEMASGTAKPSFTTFMIEEMSQGGVAAMTPEIEADIKGAASVMYASSDTTHTALLTFVLMMVLHPEVCRKAQAEIDRVLGNERFPDLEDRESLPYLECILKELYRFNPPLPLGIPHQLTEDDRYHDFEIPKGSMIISNIWSMAHSADAYAEPEVFRPERFEEMDVETAHIKDPRKYVYGFGRRICPGRYLADSSLWLAVANMLAAFDFLKARDATGKEIIPEPFFFHGAVSHVKDFPCNIRPRSRMVADMILQRGAGATAVVL